MAKSMVRPERQKKFGQDHRLISEMLTTGLKVGADVQFYSALAHNEDLFREVVRHVGKRSPGTTSAKRARGIMGRNYLGLHEAIGYFDAEFTAEELTALSTVPWSPQTLEECKDTHMLVLVPAISVSGMRERRPVRFSLDPQSIRHIEDYLKPKPAARWELICKTPVPDSFFMSWDQQRMLLETREEIPFLHCVAYMMIVNDLANDERLFSCQVVRCYETAPPDHRLSVGFIDGNGKIYIDKSSNLDRGTSIGLASCRKPD